MMNYQEISQLILNNVHKARTGNVLHQEIYLNPAIPPAKHEFLFFIKPEITLNDRAIQLDAILKMMFGKIDKFGLEIKNIRILGAAYLHRYNIMAKHYGVINNMSKKPMAYLSTDAIEKFKKAFGILPQHANVMGSLEFLDHFSEFTAVTLDELWQKSDAVKLSGGTYCAIVMVNGKPVYLINGFHPKQLIHFTEKGRSIVAFTLAGNLDWSDARNNFIGKTNPSDAAKGSLRNDLLVNRDLYGLNTVSASQNGFHLSAGPVEGLVELIRYCSDYSTDQIRKPDDFIFGTQLQDVFNSKEITRILENDFVIHNSIKVSVFDLTEEKNGDTALKLLKESSFVQDQ